MKQLSNTTIKLNCDLKIMRIKSEENPADDPSRRLSPAEAKLSPSMWEKIQQLYGPHTFDLMALDSNALLDKEGKALPHFTPTHSPSPVE